MKNQLAFLGILLFLASCSSSQPTSAYKGVPQTLTEDNTFVITITSDDETYGLTPENPVEVGGVSTMEGPLNERRYLNALAGPNGEKLSYYRAGSCCPIKSDADPLGFGSVMLDNYRVSWKGSKDTVSIYINMYDSGLLKAPVGFTIK